MTRPSSKQLATIALNRLSIPTLKTRNSDSLNFHNLAVWSVKQALREAFDAGVASAREERTQIDIHELLKERRQVAAIWGTEDVQEMRPDLDDDRAWEVLQECDRHHDCELGFNWLLIETVADDLFPSTNAGDDQ